ncbi:hypothetical protein VNO77_31758 [Canavalia gladiata]|uniref:Uncharacterized protein n=1 Tax=Canavalia gladiata TaxID=3824 RepID=A0AAN9Q1W5_CANGL
MFITPLSSILKIWYSFLLLCYAALVVVLIFKMSSHCAEILLVFAGYMEDSEQRKKRLKEMRMQADQAEVSGGVEGSGMPSSLSNPLIEAPSTTPLYAAPRFDYYTDPMSAFSSNKRSNANIQAAPDNFPPPNFGGSPMVQYSSPRPESTNPQMPTPPIQVSPAAFRNPVWNGPRGPAPYNSQSHPLSGATYSSPRFESSGRPLYNSPWGITHRPSYTPNPSPGYRNYPSPSQGRGRGFWHNTRSPVSGRGSGHGPSFHGHWSNEDRASAPDRFYKRSMVEDPWKHLKPVIWKAIDVSLFTSQIPENSTPLISKSTSTKWEGSSAASAKSYSEPSLAEYLAAAFNDATNDAENDVIRILALFDQLAFNCILSELKSKCTQIKAPCILWPEGRNCILFNHILRSYVVFSQ